MQTPYNHPGGMHPESQIRYVRDRLASGTQPYHDAYLQLIEKAESSFQDSINAMVDFSVPGFYRDAEGHRRSGRNLQSDSFNAYANALAWQLSGDERYGNRALEFLMAWANINVGYSDYDGSLVMAYSGTAMIMAAELLYHFPNWEKSEQEKFFRWAENVYLKACNEIRTRKNNWADWGRLGSALVAYLLDNPEEMAENVRLIKSDLFHKIASDGHMPEETRRGNNGIWYTYFSLAPITASFYVVYQSTGENLFLLEEDGKTINKAMDYLLYYTQNPGEWPWFENPRPGSPSNWPGVLFEAMGTVYDQKEYIDYVKNYRPLIYDSHHFAWSFPTLMPPYLNFPR
jgi:hypothetical protein